MSPIKRFIESFTTPPEATKSMSVVPGHIDGYRPQPLHEARETFAAGLARQGQPRERN